MVAGHPSNPIAGVGSARGLLVLLSAPRPGVSPSGHSQMAEPHREIYPGNWLQIYIYIYSVYIYICITITIVYNCWDIYNDYYCVYMCIYIFM